MLKKTLIGFGIFVILAIAVIAYLNHRNRTLSPLGYMEITSDSLKVSVSYSRPSVRGRVIFGTEEEGALQPYGEYWRLGANEATEITLSQNVLFNGKPLKAGTYSLYAIPGEHEFIIGVNAETGRWGVAEPDYSVDLLKTPVGVTKLESPVEQLTIRAKQAEKEEWVDLIIEWSDVRLTIPIRPVVSKTE